MIEVGEALYSSSPVLDGRKRRSSGVHKERGGLMSGPLPA
jgi:hypothetical protein